MARRVWMGVAFVSIGGAVLGFAGCVGDDPGGAPGGGPAEGGTNPNPNPNPNPAKKDLGATCASGDECGSGQCVDGVCCESACNGVCEACNLPTSVGKCAAVAAGEDPAKECKPLPPLEADGG